MDPEYTPMATAQNNSTSTQMFAELSIVKPLIASTAGCGEESIFKGEKMKSHVNQTHVQL